MKRTVIFSGTTEGRWLSEKLCAMGQPHMVCVATEYGKEMMQENALTRVHVGRMDTEEMAQFLQAEGYGRGDLVVDATHPYAVSASQNIKEAARRAHCRYLRVVRAQKSAPGDPAPDGDKTREYGQMHVYGTTLECALALNACSGNILLTTGSKDLGLFCRNVPEEGKKRLYVRVLPSPESLHLCLAEGIEPDHVIAMQGPFGLELNLALIRQYQIRHLVTKESGSAGGFEEKVKAARAAGIVSHVIRRPSEETGVGAEEALKEILEAAADRPLSKLPDEGDKETQKDSPGTACETEADRRMTVTLAGIGMGSLAGETCEVREAVASADVVFGAARLVQGLQKKETCALYQTADIIPVLEERKPRRAVILFSGDTGFFSGAKSAAGRLKAWNRDIDLQILPGISSVSFLAAKLQESYEDAVLFSLHGRNTDRHMTELIWKIRHNGKVFLLLSGAEDLRRAASRILEAGIRCRIYAGSSLSYSHEKVEELTPEEASGYACDGPVTAMIRNLSPEKRLLIPLRKDCDFVRDRVPMTKECVRHESIIRLSLRESDVLYDIGSGTGSVAVDAASLHPSLNVFAIEKKPEAAALTRENALRSGLGNVTVIEGEAPGALEGLPAPDCVFIGGSGGQLAGIIDAVHAKRSGIRFVINAVSIETVVQIQEAVRRYTPEKVEAVQLSVNEIRQAGAHHLLQANNPVFVVSFTL